MTLSPSSVSEPSQSATWSRAVATPAVEFAPTPLPVLAGTLPPGLQGHLYRNGPARLQRGQQQVGHWFDGDGAVLGVRFDRERAVGTYRYVRSTGFVVEEEAGQYLFRGYGSLGPGSLWQRLQAQLKNPANTSVLALDDRVLALWEGGLPHRLDPESLATLGTDSLGGLGAADTFSAHPKRHPRTGHWFNFGLQAGANATLKLYRSRPDGQVEQQAAIPLNGIPLIHDFVLADRYLVFCVPPLRLQALPAVLGLRSFSDALQWQPRRGTQLLVIDADSLEVVAWNQVEPWFQWHFGKGYLDADGSIELELVQYDDFTTNRQMREIGTGTVTTVADGRFCRLRLDPQTAAVQDQQVLLSRHCEFPVSVTDGAIGATAAAQVKLAPTYLNVHRTHPTPLGELFGAIARYDPGNDTLTVADAGPGCYPSEPIPVADRWQPDQTWVLTVVYDGFRHRSELWIYDGHNLQHSPVCRLQLPQVVPPSFHGTWKPGF